MTKKTMYLLGILLTIIIGAILNWILCCTPSTGAAVTTEKVVEDKVATPTPKEKVINPLVIKDKEGDFDYTTNDNINFDVSKKEILEPISTKVDTGILKLTKYLLDNPGKSVDIIGYYMSSESYSGGIFPNLGEARANEVKNYLIKRGIPSKQINLNGVIKDHMKPQDNILIGPVSFSISTSQEEDAAKADDELKKLREKIIANPLVLYFKTNQTSISLTAEQRQKVADISRYLDKVDGAKCLVVGHTDNQGKKLANKKLGQKRAVFTKNYLAKNGILKDKIKATSEGEEDPIATNKTQKGRAKNRRTVITLN